MARRAHLDTSLDIDSVLERLEHASEPEQPPEKPEAQTLNAGEVCVSYDADGNLVWEIVQETPQERMARLDSRYRKALGLIDENDVLFDNQAIEYGPDIPDRVAILEKKKGSFDPSVIALKQLRSKFSDYDFGSNGLVPKGSNDAQIYHMAIQAVRDGRIRLPTVTEYNEQKKEHEERMKQMETTNTGVPPVATTPPNQMNSQQPVTPPPQQQTPPSAPQQVTVDPKNVVRAQAFDIPAEQPQAPAAQPAPEHEETSKQAPINLFEMQERLQAQKLQEAPAAQPAPEPTPEQSAQFNVPIEKAETFYGSLPEEEKKKVVKAKVIQINEIDKVSVPMTGKIIATRDEYRRVVKRKISGDFVEVPLANSGYIATMRSAPAMQMATLVPENLDDIGNVIPDYGKRYQFVYNNLITTSVGPMSYNDFLRETGHGDLDALLWAIFKASSPNVEVSITCSNRKCLKTHRHKFSPDNVLNMAMLSNETKAQINRIIAARDIEGDAKIVHSEAPAVTLKTFELNPWCFVSVKVPDAQMMIERTPIADAIVQQYSKTIFGAMCYIKEMRVKYEESGEFYTITDPGLICEEIFNMGDDELEILLTVIQEVAETQYDSYSFKIPGPIVCPHCGTVDPEIVDEVLIDHMLFFRANQIALRE